MHVGSPLLYNSVSKWHVCPHILKSKYLKKFSKYFWNIFEKTTKKVSTYLSFVITLQGDKNWYKIETKWKYFCTMLLGICSSGKKIITKNKVSFVMAHWITYLCKYILPYQQNYKHLGCCSTILLKKVRISFALKTAIGWLNVLVSQNGNKKRK